MEKKHYIQILICSLIILISVILFIYYYQTYIAPESFVIGNVQYEDYKTLPIKDYISDEDVIFSQNINDVSFSTKDGVAIYEYNFDAKDFNGEENDYIIYVNNYMINAISDNAGTSNGTFNLTYYDVEKAVLCQSEIKISFSFYALSSRLRVTLNSEELGYLMNYFKTDNFIITLTENPYLMNSKDGEVNEKLQEIADLTNQVNVLTAEIDLLNNEIAEYLEEIEILSNNESENIAEIESLVQLVSSLEQTIAELESQVSYYQQLLDEYKNLDKNVVTFVSDLDVVKVELVNDGKFALSPINPSKLGYVFVGWSIDGETIVDVSSYVVNENITFIAVYSNVPGVYNSISKQLTIDWQEMLDKNYLVVDNGVLSRGTAYETMRSLVGVLVVDESIVSISLNTFRECHFSEIVLGNNLETIESYAFYKSSIRVANIPDSVTSIGNNAFGGCALLEDVKLSKNIDRLDYGTFAGCPISSIEIPYGVEFIGYACFSGCIMLTEVTIPNSVVEIVSDAFANCVNLKSVYIPKSVTTMNPGTTVGQAIFYGCTGLVIYCESEVEQPGWTEYWNNLDNENKHIVKYGYTYDQYLAEISA